MIAIDHHVWWTIYRWVRKKHRKAPMRDVYKRYGWPKPRGRMTRWRDGATYPIASLAEPAGQASHRANGDKLGPLRFVRRR
jgi:hypothetical protein